MVHPMENFGAYAFNDRQMKERLTPEVYAALRRTSVEGRSLDPELAQSIAKAMKDWAIEMGATHFTHWFQPLTGMTAEKHDAFLSPGRDGCPIAEFSGKELVKGETDASSFPSGGLRATFEARGYTAWDPSSYAFVKDDVLYIPTAYCAFGGQALDMKTPLLRSMEALSRQALRIVRLFGDTDAARVIPMVGAEQEYFLVDKAVASRRPDLIVCGRTLFGAKPPKGQELDDYFFGTIKPRVQAFMKELNEELWKLGVYSKTEHNEAAPSQHELAVVYSTVNISADQNQLTMELMKRLADKHGLLCLLHEKPFQSINGSGKHNNFSIATDTGHNLLEPGKTPAQNVQFLLILSAMLALADDYQDLLRVSVAYAGNDCRLGGWEAPPAIISVFLGDELTELIDSIIKEEHYEQRNTDFLRLGVHILPKFTRDTTDRNRTSPLTFTGNKFEFRSPGSNQSISAPNLVLCAALADELEKMADELETADNFNQAVDSLIRRTFKEHRRIIFNGNNYHTSWVKEAAKRGLCNLSTTVDALPCYLAEKNVAMLERQQVFTREEIHGRYEVKLDNYVNVVEIEALSMLDMAGRMILPAALRYTGEVADTLQKKLNVLPELPCLTEKKLIESLSLETDALSSGMETLKAALQTCDGEEDKLTKARLIRDRVLPAMGEVRRAADALEPLVSREEWPIPTYEELLTSV